jgi:predicted lysophospholipase L1 biosynthesis ABC-type transport system permease subunit
MFTSALDEPPGPVAYFPEEQPSNWPSFVLRVQQPTAALLIAVEREVRAAAPLGVVGKAATMGTRLMDSARDRSFATLVLVFFATSAVAVSVAGIAGVVGFVVARRTRELAIRMAIGARPAQVRRLVTREALTAALLGAAVGLATGGWLSRILESLLYGLEPADPSSLVIAAVLAVASAVAAGWWPARRATRLAPSTALREE